MLKKNDGLQMSPITPYKGPRNIRFPTGDWLKIFFAFLFTILLTAFALIPEIVMVFVWHLISPHTPVQKMFLIAIFFFGGGSLCVGFAFLALFLWSVVVTSILE